MRCHRWVASALACAAVGAVTACEASVYPARTPQLHVTVAGGCPATLGTAQDVSNVGGELKHHLVPHGDQPTVALICQYHAGPDAEAVLRTSTRLDARQAGRLADALAHISLRAATGEFHSPNEIFGAVSIIALHYLGRPDVDLWYDTSGCQTVDNGHVQAFEGANASFYSGFMPVFSELAASG